MRTQQRGDRTGKQPRRLRHALDRERAIAATEPKPGQRCRTEIGDKGAVPCLPVAASRQLGRQRFGKAAHRRQHAALRRRNVQCHRQPVCLGNGVEQQRQRIALCIGPDRLGIGGDLGAAIGDCDLARQPPFLSLTSDRRFKNQAIDAHRADVDIKIGQQRLAGVGHDPEFGRLAHRHRRSGRRANVNMVREIADRPPVDPDLGRRQEHPLRIGQREVADHHLAIKGSVEPADADLHPVFELMFFDLGDHEAASGIAVQPDEEQREQQDQPQQRQTKPA